MKKKNFWLLHVIAILKVMPLIAAASEELSARAALILYIVVSVAGEYLKQLGDYLDDGKLNKSFAGPAAIALFFVLPPALTGCAVARTNQSAQADGSAHTVTTIVSVWDAKGVINNFRATQSQKTQTTSLGSSGAESSGTNAIAVLDKLKGIVEALPK